MTANTDLNIELAPKDKLRVGMAYAPKATPVFVAKDAVGKAHGVPFDIATELARTVGLEMEVFLAATTAELTQACSSGAIDIGFMPIDEERRKLLDFSPSYFEIQSTYLVAASSSIRTLAEVDSEGVAVVGIAGSTTLRAAGRSLKKTNVIAAQSIAEAMSMMKSNQVQAFALTHDALPNLQKELPGSRILEGAFQVTGVALAIQKNRPAALEYITRFIQNAKVNGIIRLAFDQAGLHELKIAP